MRTTINTCGAPRTACQRSRKSSTPRQHLTRAPSPLWKHLPKHLSASSRNHSNNKRTGHKPSEPALKRDSSETKTARLISNHTPEGSRYRGCQRNCEVASVGQPDTKTLQLGNWDLRSGALHFSVHQFRIWPGIQFCM